MRRLLSLCAVTALAACAAPEVDTQGGVGFQDYNLYQQQQAYLARSRAAPPPQQPAQVAPAPLAAAVASAPAPAGAPLVATAPLDQPLGAPPAASGAESIGADTLAALGVAPTEAAGAPLSATTPPPGAPAAFAAAPVAPSAPSGTNVAAFALSTSHPVGQPMYRRSNPFRNSAGFERACARYPSDSLAQEAFLEAGGPERDRLNLDPDGDGYACKWDPAAFRLARGG